MPRPRPFAHAFNVLSISLLTSAQVIGMATARRPFLEPQPLLLGHDRVFLSAGYGHGAAVIQLEASGGRFSRSRLHQRQYGGV